MKKETRAFIDELVKQKQYKKDNGPIDISADDLWKYSGKVEEEKEGFYPDHPQHYRHKEIKKVMIYNTFSSNEDLVIESYFRNPNRNITEIAEDLNECKNFVTKTISKYLTIKRNENINNE